MRASFLAQGYGLAVTTTLQVVTTPLLLSAWGIDNAGAWLVAAAIGANAVLTELGYTYAAKTGMVIAIAGGRRQQASCNFAAAAMVVLTSNALCVALGSLILVLVPEYLLSFFPPTARQADVLHALALLLLNGLLQTHTLLLCSGVRAIDGPAQEAAQATTIRLVEAAVMLFAAWSCDRLAVAAGAMCAVRLTGNVLLWRRLAATDIVPARTDGLSRSAIWRMAPSALGYLIMPAAQTLWIQLPVLVLGSLASPTEIVQYVAMRTIARIGTTLGNVLNNVAGPEYSACFGAANATGLKKLMRKHFTFGFALMGGVALGTWICGGVGVRYLTQGHANATGVPFALLIAAVLVEIAWTSAFTCVAALDQHSKLAVRVLLAAALSSAALYPLVAEYGVVGATAALLVGNLLALSAAVHGLRLALASFRVCGSPPA